MPSGKVPIAESSTIAALRSRQWSRRRPLSAGVISLLTVVCWAVWMYLVLPLVSLLLWALGVRLFLAELTKGGYEGLRTSLVAYSSVVLVLAGLLASWILWNVRRYGGSHDRRTAKRAEVTDLETQRAFHLDESLLAVLRDERLLRIDLDQDDCVVVIAAAPSREVQPAISGSQRLAGPQPASPRERGSTRSG
jgi:poly-beta-1,6-N-acetyl-D-glucosamine biosynthesis protein PgaD